MFHRYLEKNNEEEVKGRRTIYIRIEKLLMEVGNN